MFPIPIPHLFSDVGFCFLCRRVGKWFSKKWCTL